MGDTPVPVNPVIQTVDDIIKALIFGAGVNAAIAALTSAVPFLGLPIIKQLVAGIVNYIANLLYTQLEQNVAFQIINLQTDAEQQAYQKAEWDLRNAQASGDANALAAAKQNFKDTLGKLIHFDGA